MAEAKKSSTASTGLTGRVSPSPLTLPPPTKDIVKARRSIKGRCLRISMALEVSNHRWTNQLSKKMVNHQVWICGYVSWSTGHFIPLACVGVRNWAMVMRVEWRKAIENPHQWYPPNSVACLCLLICDTCAHNRAQSRTHTHNHTHIYIYIYIGIHKKSLISKGGYPQKVIACYWTEKPQANNPRWVVLAEVFSDSLDSEVKIHMTWANRLEHGCFVGGAEDGYSISYDELYNVFASSILIYLNMCYLFRNKVPKLATMCWCPSPILELLFIPWVGWSSGCIWILDIGGYELTTILQIHPCYNRIYNVPIPKMLNIKGPLYWGFSWATNISSWLVARFAIVANFLQIILKLMYCLESSLLWQKNGRAFFWKKNSL